MTTVIDALILEIGIDPAKAKAGTREMIDDLRKFEAEAKKRGTGAEKSVNSLESSFVGLQKRMLGVAGLMLGGLGIEQMIQRVTKLQVATDNLGRTFGTQSQVLQRWGAAGERFGVSGGAVQQGLIGLQQQRYNLQNFGDPSGVLSLSWATRGTKNPLIAQGANGQLLDPEKLALNISKWLEKAGPQGANALMKMGGLSQEFVTFLMQGPEKIKKVLEETKHLAPTDEEIRRFREINDAFEKTSQAAQRLAMKLTSDLAPVLISIFEALDQMTNSDEMMKTLQLLKEGKFWEAFKREFIPAPLQRGPDKYDLKNKEDKLKRLETEINNQRGTIPPAAIEHLERERTQLIEEIRKLRMTLEKGVGGATVQQQSFTTSGDNVRVWKASLGGGGWTPPANPGGGNIEIPNGPNVPPGPSRGGASKNKNENAQRLYDELIRIGHTHDQASAALGHAQHESGFNPYVKGDSGTAHGMFQWRGKRWMDMQQKSKEWGLDPYSPEAAARFLDWELRSTEKEAGRAYFGAKDVDSATTALNRYERFRGWQAGQPGRYVSARRFKNSMKPSIAIERPFIPNKNSRVRDEMQTMLDFNQRPGGFGGGSSSNSVSIGNISIHTQAKDAEGIAASIKPAIERFARIASSNNGPA